MRSFKKSDRLNNVSCDVCGPVLEEAGRMQEEGMRILKSDAGNPAPFGSDAPDKIVCDMIVNVRDSEGYSDSKGILSARRAIEQYRQLKKFPNVTISDIYTGNGMSELITMCVQDLLNSGDEVLMPIPDYPLRIASVSLAGGTSVHYICDEQAGWYPDIDGIKLEITSSAKTIVIINPNNPTGALYPKELSLEIVKVARQDDLITCSDEIYDRLVTDGLVRVPTAALAPDLLVVTLNGPSKSHRVAGFRYGWMVLGGNKSRVKGYIEGLSMLTFIRLCSNVLPQQITRTTLGGYRGVGGLLSPDGRIYGQREFIYNAINGIPGLSAVRPRTAFHIFPEIDTARFDTYDDEKFVLDFLHKHHTLLAHGGGFNWQ